MFDFFRDVVFVEFAVERAARDAKELGGAGAVAAALVEGGENFGAFSVGKRSGRSANGQGLWAKGWGKVGGGEAVAGGEDHHALDDAAEFADVAGPGVGLEKGEGVGRDGTDGALVKVGKFFEEVGGKKGDVAVAVFEGGEGDVDDVDAEVEVFAEFALANPVFEVAVGGGDKTEVDVDRGFAADAFEAAFLKDAEEFDLERGVELGDFVEEEGAGVGEFEAAFATAGGAGEGAFFVAEEFGLEEGRGEGGAMDGDEGFLSARGEVVDGLGDEFLAGAGGAAQEDGGLGGRGLLEEGEDVLHGGGVADDGVEGVTVVELGVEALVFGFEGAGAEGALEEEFEVVEVDGLGEEVGGAFLHGFDSGLDGAVGGEENDDEIGVGGAGATEELEAVGAGHAQVGEHEVGRGVGDEAESGVGVFGEADVVVGAKGAFESVAGVFVVVNDEDGGLHGGEKRLYCRFLIGHRCCINSQHEFRVINQPIFGFPSREFC